MYSFIYSKYPGPRPFQENTEKNSAIILICNIAVISILHLLSRDMRRKPPKNQFRLPQPQNLDPPAAPGILNGENIHSC